MENLIYRINTREVSQENIEGEVVAISLTSGACYNMTETAADIWSQLVNGATLPDCVGVLLGRYIVSHEEAERAVQQFLEALEQEGMVRTQPIDDNHPSELEFVSFANKRPFTAPRIDRIDDMKDIVMLDPARDLSGSAWPIVKEEKDS